MACGLVHASREPCLRVLCLGKNCDLKNIRTGVLKSALLVFQIIG